MRLDKYLADMKVGTRSEVKKIISSGKVTINGEVVKKSDYKVKDDDVVVCDGENISYVEYEYYILNKPADYLSATFDEQDKVVMDLIDSKRKDLVPVGRLDKDSEGLLLITNDGQLNHFLLSPKNHVNKKYYVDLDKPLEEGKAELFKEEMDLGDFIAKPAIYEKITDTSAYLTIQEGKFHQVKRMFEHLGSTVTYLKRVQFKNLTLGDLKVGEYRLLTDEELEDLKK
ncbi:MAG: pseudouridine synthase [Erysipelotrichaceae bacterium]|nr:pseudouridine synthase [Erysipelotrichaceae bacterium]